MTQRCFSCDAPFYAHTGAEFVRCKLCSAFFTVGSEQPEIFRAELLRRVTSGHFRTSHRVTRGMLWGMNVYALRSAATRFGYRARIDGLFSHLLKRVPLTRFPFDVAMKKVEGGEIHSAVAVGAISRESEVSALSTMVQRYKNKIREFCFIVDCDSKHLPELQRYFDDQRTYGIDIRVYTHPLNDNYAAQRNLVHDISSKPWILQLDTDETLDADAVDALGWVVHEADWWGADVIGFRRRNYVDGAMSNLFPDVQYRLARRQIRYRNQVHESPLIGLPWWKSMLCLRGAINHRLEREWVTRRSQRYGQISSGANRPKDEHLLLQSYDGIIEPDTSLL